MEQEKNTTDKQVLLLQAWVSLPTVLVVGLVVGGHGGQGSNKSICLGKKAKPAGLLLHKMFAKGGVGKEGKEKGYFPQT